MNDILSNEKILSIAKQNTRLYYRTLKAYHPATYKFINDAYLGRNISEKIYKHIYGEQFCLNCNKLLEGRGFKGLLKGYSVFCSDKCASKHPYRLQKINESNYKKHGVKWNGQIKSAKETRKINNIKKYGVSHVLQIPSVLEKKNATCIKNHGTKNYTNREKCKNTNLKKYGVESVSQVSEIHTRQQKFKMKKFILPSGKEVKIQGYEPMAINALLKIYKETDIEVSRSKMPAFWYHTPDNIKHRYFPDIFIKLDNLIVEVKSTWTNRIDKNLYLKKQSILDAGFKFQKMVFNRKGELINEQ